MGLEAVASLIVATFDLKVVQLLRSAILTADVESAKNAGGGKGNASTPAATFTPRPVVHPEPRYEPRRVIHPTPRIEPRPILHPSAALDIPKQAPVPADPEQPVRCKSFIQPPWKKLVWENPIPPRAVVKIVVHRPDTVCKGSLIDYFI